MYAKFLTAIIVLLAAILSGCGGDHGGSVNPLPPSAAACPLANLSKTQVTQIANNVVHMRNEKSATTWQDRTAKLVFELSRTGVSDAAILQSMQSGDFANIMSWLQKGDDNFNDEASLQKLSNCEEN